MVTTSVYIVPRLYPVLSIYLRTVFTLALCYPPKTPKSPIVYTPGMPKSVVFAYAFDMADALVIGVTAVIIHRLQSRPCIPPKLYQHDRVVQGRSSRTLAQHAVSEQHLQHHDAVTHTEDVYGTCPTCKGTGKV